MDVTVVIVSYNVADFLKDCLDSIKNETACRYEIFIIDNNSSDDSIQIVKKKFPEVKLIQNSANLGFARANNMGFKHAKGRYIFMLNPDTVIFDKAIDKLVLFMDKHPEVGACGPKNLNSDFTLQYNCHHFPSLSMALVETFQLKRLFRSNKFFGRESMTYWGYDEVKEVDWITGSALLIKKDILDQVGLLDENYFMYSEECDLAFKLKKIGKKILFNPEAALIHFGGQSSLGQYLQSVHSKTITQYFYQSRYYFFKNNYGKVREFLLRSIDIFYFTVVLLRNKISFWKKNRQETIYTAEVVLNVAFSKCKMR